MRALRKSYGGFEAVRDLSFSVDEGEVVAVLGPNGAGKTTIVEILEGYRERDGGEVIELVDLGEKATSRVRTLSGGQQRRLDLGLGLIGDPDLLFLDEPTLGFDPSARRQAWDVIRRLSDLGKTVLLTTHYMEEAQALADRVVVIAAGQKVVDGSPESTEEAARVALVHTRAPDRGPGRSHCLGHRSRRRARRAHGRAAVARGRLSGTHR